MSQQEQESVSVQYLRKDSLVEENLFEISFSSDNNRLKMAEVKVMWLKAVTIWDTAACGFVSVSRAKPSVPTSLETEVVIGPHHPTGYSELGI